THGPCLVVRNRAHVVAPEAREQRRLLDRAVALAGRVDDERVRLRLKAAASEAEIGRAFPRRDERDQRARRRRVLNDASPRWTQIDHLAQPVAHDLLELGQRWTALPGKPEHPQTSAHEVT